MTISPIKRDVKWIKFIEKNYNQQKQQIKRRETKNRYLATEISKSRNSSQNTKKLRKFV